MSTTKPIRPQLDSLTRIGVMAGRVAYRAEVTWTDGESYIEKRVTHFNGPTSGSGPVVMISDLGTQTIVDDPGRFGTFGAFGAQWVRDFYSNASL